MKRRVLCCILAAITLTSVSSVWASKLSDKMNQKSTVDKNISRIQNNKKEQEKKKKNTQAQRDAALQAEKDKEKEYQEAVKKIKELDKEIKTTEDSLKEAEQNYDAQEAVFKAKLRAMYEASDTTYLEMLAQSKSIMDFFERIEAISLISKSNKSAVEELKTIKQDIDYKREVVEAQKIKAQEYASKKQVALNDIKVSRAGLDAEIAKINQKLNQLEAEEDSMLKASDELESQIRSLQSKGTRYAGGSMLWPTPSTGSISSYFGNRMHPILKTYRMHTGIDINASYGVSIIAANNGTVLFAGWDGGGYGNKVVIDHGGNISTLYAHCSRILVSSGQKVNAGDVIAKVGSTGLSTGPHLHFEVRNNGAPVDPLGYTRP